MLFRASMRWKIFAAFFFVTVCIPCTFGGTKYVPKWKKQVRASLFYFIFSVEIFCEYPLKMRSFRPARHQPVKTKIVITFATITVT